MQLFFTINAPHQWVIADHKGKVDSGLVEGLEALPPANGRLKWVAVVPGEQVVSREVDIPATGVRKQLAAIPYVIEDDLADNVDAMHFALLAPAGEGPASVAYTARSTMDDWLGQLAAAGIQPDAMVPDYLLLPRTDTGATSLAQDAGGRILMRCGMQHGAVVDADTLALWLQQQGADRVFEVGNEGLAASLAGAGIEQVQRRDIGSGLADWLRGGYPPVTTSLLQGDYLPRQQRSPLRPYRVAAVLAMLALLALAGLDVAEYTWLKRQQASLEATTGDLYQQLFPGSRLVPGKARTQTQAQLDELLARHGGNDFRTLLAPVARILKSAGATVDEVQFRDSTLITVVSLRNFSHLDNLKKRLEGEASVSAQLMSSGARGDKVQARFEIVGVRI